LARGWEKLAFVLYCLTLILAPLLFGAVHTPAFTLIFLCILSATPLLLRGQVKKDFRTGRWAFFCPRTGMTFLFAALLLFLAWQAAPLPQFVVQAGSPKAFTAFQASSPPPEVLASTGDTARWARLAPYTYPVRMSILRWIVYGSFFFGLVQTLKTRKRIETVILCILLTASFVSLYGMLQTPGAWSHLWGGDRTWIRPPGTSGTFFFSDSFAALMVMGLLLAVAWAAAFSGDVVRRPPPQERSVRDRWTRLLSGKPRLHRRALAGFFGLFIAAGLLLSGSRAGIVSAAAGLLFMALPFLFRKGQSGKGQNVLQRLSLLLLLGLLVGFTWVLFLGMSPNLNRYRPAVVPREAGNMETREILKLFLEYPATGIGLGTAPHALSRFQETRNEVIPFPGAGTDGARFLAEGGMAGLVLLLAGVFWFTFALFRTWKDRRDPFAVCLGLLPGAAMASMAFYSLLGSCLHVPSNVLTFAALLAVGFIALHLQRRRQAEKSLVPVSRLPLRFRGGLLLAVVVGCTGWAAYWTARNFLAETVASTVTVPGLNDNSEATLAELRRAVRLDGGNAEYHYRLAMAYRKVRDNPQLPVTGPEPDPLEIVAALETAVARNPLSAPYHQALGWEYSFLWQQPDYGTTCLPAADLAMNRAAAFSRETDPGLQRKMGNYWLLRSKSLPPTEEAWDAAISRAGGHYRSALSRQTGETRQASTKKIRNFIWTVYPDESFQQRLLKPDS